LEQAIHWAQLAAKYDPSIITIIINSNNNWYLNITPYVTKYQDTHVIAHFLSNTLQYYEPTIPLEINEPCNEPLAIQILCIYHQNINIGNLDVLQ
jgi:hypothetical protein